MGEYCTRVVRAPNETFVLSLSLSLSLSVPSAPLSSCSSAPLQPRSLFLHPQPPSPSSSVGLCPFHPSPSGASIEARRSRCASSRRERTRGRTLQRRGNGHIFIPTRRPTNSRNVIAQLRGSFSPDQLRSFRSCWPILPFRFVSFRFVPFCSFPFRQLATTKRACQRFSATNERERPKRSHAFNFPATNDTVFYSVLAPAKVG